MATISLVNQTRTMRPGEMEVTILSTGEVVNLYLNNIKLATKPNIPIATRNTKVVQSLGRSGFLLIDMRTKAPVEFEIKLSAFHGQPQDREDTLALLERLEGLLVRFSFYTDPYASYEGFLTDIQVENNRGYSQVLSAKVTVQPYRIFNVANNRITLTSGDVITFDKGTLAPQLIIRGTGDISITHNDKTMQFVAVPNVPITVDCVQRRVYHDASKNTVTNYHHLKVSDGYIQLVSGKPITWTGNVMNIELVYEWRST